MPDKLTLEELSRRTAVPEERLREWRSRGLIGRDGSDEFAFGDAERVRLIELCLRRGISLQAVADAARESGLLDRYRDLIFSQGVALTVTAAEAAEIVGLDLVMFRKLSAAVGFPEPRD